MYMYDKTPGNSSNRNKNRLKRKRICYFVWSYNLGVFFIANRIHPFATKRDIHTTIPFVFDINRITESKPTKSKDPF